MCIICQFAPLLGGVYEIMQTINETEIYSITDLNSPAVKLQRYMYSHTHTVKKDLQITQANVVEALVSPLCFCFSLVLRKTTGARSYIFTSPGIYVKREGRTLFLLPILLWSSSWRLKFIHSQFPLPMTLNSVFSFIKMSDRDLKFVNLFCQTNTFLFVIETPMRKCKHPFSRNEHLQNVEH